MVYLTGNSREVFLTPRILYFQDKENKVCFSDIISGKYDSAFVKNTSDFLSCHGINNNYWIKISVTDCTDLNFQWMFESWDFRINEFDIYVAEENGYKILNAGTNQKFYDRQIYHKNLNYLIPKIPGKEQQIIIRAKADHVFGLYLMLRRVDEFIFYSLNEYILLGIFYGIVFIMAVYNLFLFVSVRDKSYLYYVLYVISIGAVALDNDGLGFQYLWANIPALNNFIVRGSIVVVLVISAIFYCKEFLRTVEWAPVLNKILNAVIVIRIMIFFYAAAFDQDLLFNPLLTLIPLGIIYYAGIYSLLKGNIAARYYVIAFTALFLGFLLVTLRNFTIIEWNLFTNYVLNFAAVLEMILLSLAIGDRMKNLKVEKEKAQAAIISRLKENETLKDKLNLELEEKVKQRTTELQIQKDLLEEKNKELDLFVSKASHDIKGPLKSLMTLAQLGARDVNDQAAQNYFDHILKSSTRLDNTLMDLLTFARHSNTKLEKKEINFQKITEDVLCSLQNLDGFEYMTFETEICQDIKFFSTEKLVYSIIQNLVENAIKYKDNSKPSFLKIKIKTYSDYCEMIFKDNGIGIAKEKQSQVFDMFFKLNDGKDNSTGLGLYLVKTSVEKLGGKISLWSEAGQGTEFTIQLKNQRE